MQLVIIGEGRFRSKVERHAQLSGMEHRIRFTGPVSSGEALRNELDRADLFVLASRAEGVPRAMIEAMARGIPCIGSAVGGITELLDAENLFPNGNAPALARKIREVLNEPYRMTGMSALNLAKARNYLSSVLSGRRREFYTHVRQATQDWKQRCYPPAGRTA
jgi:glycosyltransferase involved in cell wall biosynthesis